jgi:2',3'-cyclic-nucleotide 2'-phosphodiesterase (5'-nucleotidase family)
MKYILKFFLILLLFVACKPTRTFLADERVSAYRMKASDTLVADPLVEALILPYRSKLEGQMNEVIGKSAKELTYGGAVSLMGNWATDILLAQSSKYYGKNIDFATVNQGGLRIRSLPKGDITRGKMYELMPFENMLVVLTTDSAGVQQFINYMASRGGWPISGVRYSIRDSKPENIFIGGQQLRGGRNYTFALSDYSANGGDNTEFLKTMKRTDLNKLMRDAFIEGVIETTKQGKLVDAELDNRIVIFKKE